MELKVLVELAYKVLAETAKVDEDEIRKDYTPALMFETGRVELVERGATL